MKRDVNHDVPSHLIHRYANASVGGAKIMAKALSVCKSLAEKWSQKAPENGNEDQSGTRNPLDRIEGMMVEVANSGHPEVAYLFLKYIMEAHDQIMESVLNSEIESVEKIKNGDSKPYFKIVKAATMFGIMLLVGGFGF